MESEKSTKFRNLVIILILVTLISIFASNVYDDYKDSEIKKQQEFEKVTNDFINSLTYSGDLTYYDSPTGKTKTIDYEDINHRYENYTIFNLSFINNNASKITDCNLLEVHKEGTWEIYPNLREPSCNKNSVNFLVAIPNNASLMDLEYGFIDSWQVNKSKEDIDYQNSQLCGTINDSGQYSLNLSNNKCLNATSENQTVEIDYNESQAENTSCKEIKVIYEDNKSKITKWDCFPYNDIVTIDNYTSNEKGQRIMIRTTYTDHYFNNQNLINKFNFKYDISEQMNSQWDKVISLNSNEVKIGSFEINLKDFNESLNPVFADEYGNGIPLNKVIKPNPKCNKGNCTYYIDPLDMPPILYPKNATFYVYYNKED